MLTRRQALGLIAAGVAVVFFGTSEAHALRSFPKRSGGTGPQGEFVADREVRLALADIGKRGRIVCDEGERIRLTIVNDTKGSQRVGFEGALFLGTEHVSLRAGQSVTLELTLADIERTGTIRSNGASLSIEIRPSYQSRELHLNF